MPDSSGTPCTVVNADGPCPNLAASGVPVCGPCLGIILHETDPGRRRALATLERLPTGVLTQLIGDADDGVRARVAVRGDLDAGTISRYADPDREPSPIVWRAIASTPGGAAHAAGLLGCGDAGTLMVLAANPATNPAIVEDLAAHPDVDVAGVADAIRHHRPLDPRLAQQILDAQRVPTRAIEHPPDGLETASLPTPIAVAVPPIATEPGQLTNPDAPPAGHEPGPNESKRTRTTLVYALLAIVVLALIVTAVGFNASSKPDHRVLRPPERTEPTRAPATSTPASTVTVATSSTTPPQPAPTTAPAPPANPQPVNVTITVTAQTGQFCNQVALHITSGTPSADTVVTDDAGTVLWQGTWHADETHTIQLSAPTTHLHVQMHTIADPDQFHPSGSVSGSFC